MAFEEVTIGDARLICARAEDALPTLPDASAHLILVDPPYMGTKLSYAGERVEWDRQWKTRTAYLDWLRGLAKEWRRILQPNGSLYCFASPQMAAWVEVTLSETFNIIQRLTWRKPPFSTKAEMFDKDTCRMFFPASEAIIFAEQVLGEAAAKDTSGYWKASFALHKQVYAPLGCYIQEERKRAGLSRNDVDLALGFVSTSNPQRGTSLCYRWEEGSSLPTRETYERLRAFFNTRNGRTDYLRREYEDLRREYEDLRREYEDLRREYEDLRRPFTVSASVPFTDVFDFQTVPAHQMKHPCQKPLALLRHLIEVSSRPGDCVLDCFFGSGSTLEAAKQLGRRGIGIEMERKWFTAGQATLRQTDLFATLQPRAPMSPPPAQVALF